MKVKLISHTDLDGYGCNIIANYVFGKDNVDSINVNYNNVNEIVLDYIVNEEYKNYDITYITDISINKEVAEVIHDLYKNKKINIMLLDHHKNLDYLNKYYWVSVQTHISRIPTCGTELFYDELLFYTNEYVSKKLLENDNILKLVDMVRDYDTWKWEKDENIKPKQLNDLFFILNSDRFEKELICCDYDPNELIYKYELILELEQEKINKLVENKQKELKKVEIYDKNNKKYNCGVVFSENYISEIGNSLAKINKDLDFIVIINIGSKKASFRTIRNDIDLSKLVKESYCGGGHPKASGFEFNDIININLIKNILDI